MVFKSNDKLFEHSRLLETCQVRNFERPEGLTERLEVNLKKRRKTTFSEEEKWIALFKMLFPGVDEGSIPSPYYGKKYPQWEEQAALGRHSSRYDQYIERELPAILQRRLEYAVAGLVGPLESQLRSQLQDIVRESQAEALHSYRITNPPRPAPIPPSPKRSFESFGSSTSSPSSPVEIDWSAFIVPSPRMEHRYVNPQDIERGRRQ
ncbi:hypothetical protein B0T16DRAFT_224332 [Cercophora newfieldiana]|uniref:Uncharacterized protein n=1 Tax=Cercophora newfieldiana TaxID=92897 RepID=A0AA40CKP9_9PEZI|nr:hypothetical protein B0T16DRAFT_224332 [Cercophora newfieldiana]